MISDQYKQLYGGGGGGAAILNNKNKDHTIISSLKRVQNEMCADIFSKLNEPVRRRTLSKTPERNTVEGIRKALNIDSQNHKINSQTTLDSQIKELTTQKTPTSASSPFVSNFCKTPQSQNNQKINFSLSSRSKSPTHPSEKYRSNTSSNAYQSENLNNPNHNIQPKYATNSIISSYTSTQKNSEDFSQPHLNLTKEQMRQFYEQQKKNNQQQLDQLMRSSQEMLKSELNDINNQYQSETEEYTSCSTLHQWEKEKSNQQIDSNLTTNESYGEQNQQQKINSNINQNKYLQQQQTIDITSSINESPNNRKSTPKNENQQDLSKQNISKSYVSFRKNSRSPLPRNSQARNSKSPISLDTKNYQNFSSPTNKIDQKNYNEIRSKQVSFSHDVFIVESKNTPKSCGSELSNFSGNIFSHSTKELERQYQQHILNNPQDLQQKREYEELLSIVKKEKQIILNEIKYLIEQRNKYKDLHEGGQLVSQDLTKSVAFKKVMTHLDTTSLNTGNFLKIQQKQDSLQQMLSTIKNKDEVIQVQKIVINRLLSQLNQKQQHQY